MNQDYRGIVWDAFRPINARAGHVVPIRSLRFGAMRQMNSAEQELFIADADGGEGQGVESYLRPIFLPKNDYKR